MSFFDEDDEFGGLDDPFVPRDPDTGDPDPAGDDDEPTVQPPPVRRPSILRRLFGR